MNGRCNGDDNELALAPSAVSAKLLHIDSKQREALRTVAEWVLQWIYAMSVTLLVGIACGFTIGREIWLQWKGQSEMNGTSYGGIVGYGGEAVPIFLTWLA